MEKEPQKALERRLVRENSVAHIPVKAKACSIRALSIMNSHILIERMFWTRLTPSSEMMSGEHLVLTCGSKTLSTEGRLAQPPTQCLSLIELHSVYTAGQSDSGVLF